jgi:Holliday junction resolvase RusA-like endonuclease
MSTPGAVGIVLGSIGAKPPDGEGGGREKGDADEGAGGETEGDGKNGNPSTPEVSKVYGRIGKEGSKKLRSSALSSDVSRQDSSIAGNSPLETPEVNRKENCNAVVDLTNDDANDNVITDDVHIPACALAIPEIPPHEVANIAIVYGTPRAQARHKRSRHGVYYNPSSKQQRTFADACWYLSPMTGALQVELCFYFERPLTHFIGRERDIWKLRPDAPVHHTQVPDIDNLVKLVLDALTPRVFANDCVIVSIVAKKKWTARANAARTLVEIKQV